MREAKNDCAGEDQQQFNGQTHKKFVDHRLRNAYMDLHDVSRLASSTIVR
jgi:hypothetical protein